MKAIIDIRNKGSKISKHIYGHFSEHLGECIYGGYWVGENSDIPNKNGVRTDVIEAMKRIQVPNIRWPGGCFADDYYWMEGIGPKEERATIVNTHWGGKEENNHFGTHEFMDLCEELDCEPYICGNVGSGTVREMRNWVEYLTYDGNSSMAKLRKKNGREKAWGIKYFGIGNENWGCGGFMKADYYANEFRRYATYVRNYKGMGETNWWESPQLIKIAGGHNAERDDWTETLMKEAGNYMGGLSIHCYINPGKESHGTEFSKDSWYQTALNTYKKEPLLKKNISIMDYYDPGNNVAMVVDEWGIWVDNEPGTNNAFLYQQNTMRSAMCAALMFHIFHKYSDRIRMCNLAQTINVLQSIILTKDKEIVKTPTYHIFDLFKEHQENVFIPITWDNEPKKIEKGLPEIDASVSFDDENNRVIITAINLSADDEKKFSFEILDKNIKKVECQYISGEVTAHNDFNNPQAVTIANLDKINIKNKRVDVNLPKCAIAVIKVYI